MIPGTTFVDLHDMSTISVHDIIHSEQAKTMDQAVAIVQYMRVNGLKNDGIQLDFSGINWVTSMFTDKLIRLLVSFYGNDFESKLQVTGIEQTNVMFNVLWNSAIEKLNMGTITAQA